MSKIPFGGLIGLFLWDIIAVTVSVTMVVVHVGFSQLPDWTVFDTNVLRVLIAGFPLSFVIGWVIGR